LAARRGLADAALAAADRDDSPVAALGGHGDADAGDAGDCGQGGANLRLHIGPLRGIEAADVEHDAGDPARQPGGWGIAAGDQALARARVANRVERAGERRVNVGSWRHERGHSGEEAAAKAGLATVFPATGFL
jgi:hypothetical protein